MPHGEGYSDQPQIHRKVAGTLLHMNSQEFLAGFQASPAAETNIVFLFMYLSYHAVKQVFLSKDLVSFRRVGKDYTNLSSFLAPTTVKLQLAQHQFTPFKKGSVRICLSTGRSVRTLIDSILYDDQDS